jgi:hypothetical protein
MAGNERAYSMHRAIAWPEMKGAYSIGLSAMSPRCQAKGSDTNGRILRELFKNRKKL